MKNLVIFCHPNPKSFNAAIRESYIEGAKEKNDVKIRDLYTMGFNPVLSAEDFASLSQGKIPTDIASEQEAITWADVITFIFPVWWFGLPATVKGYIDRVFSKDFAYTYTEDGPKGLLTEKKVLLLTTTGGTKEMYTQIGLFDSLKQTIDFGIFNFCGMDVTEHKYFNGVIECDDTTRKKMLQDAKEIGLKLK